MNREEVEAQAKRLGLDISGMEWPQALSLVSQKLREEDEQSSTDHELKVKELEARLAEANQKILGFQQKYEGRAKGRPPTKKELLNKEILIAPFIPRVHGNYPTFSFHEELGQDVECDEIHLSLKDMRPGAQFDEDSGVNEVGRSTKIRGKKANKVIAQTAGPRKNVQIYMSLKEGGVPIAYDRETGEKGYMWGNPVYFTIRDLVEIVDMGTYAEKYKKEIIKNQRMVGPHVCIPIQYGNALIKKIEDEEKVKAQNGGF